MDSTERKPGKPRVSWTQHEETVVALEVRRMRRGEVSRKGPSGHEAVSLPSQLNLAMSRVLDKSRHMSVNAFYTSKARYTESWLNAALARAPNYETRPAAVSDEAVAAPALEPEAEALELETPEPADPELERLLVMGSLVDTFMSYIGGAITKGVKQALVELRNEEEMKLRSDGDYTSSPQPIPTTAREIVKRKIDVIGLMPMQKHVVQKSPVARLWDIRFLQSGQEHGKAYLRDRVILCTKFITHQQQSRYQQIKADIHYANGGAMSVIKELERLSKAPNGRDGRPMH